MSIPYLTSEWLSNLSNMKNVNKKILEMEEEGKMKKVEDSEFSCQNKKRS
jgi:hypothetical protein